jgi:two-component system NtrC family sensor kinase
VTGVQTCALPISKHSVGKNIQDIPEVYPIFQRLGSTGQYVTEMEFPNSRTKRMVDIEAVHMRDKQGYSVGLLILMRDITDRMRMIDGIYSQDRLASIGKLTAGVAHEINNPLAIMKGLAELLLDSNIPEETKDDIRIIDGEVERVSTVVQNLLAFSRKQQKEKTRLNINKVISQTLRVEFYEKNTHNIRIVPEFGKNLPEIFGNEMQLTQVMVNIFMNNKEILRGAGGGTMTVSTFEQTGKIIIRISDDGPGISPEHITHIFDPFYTTKGFGQGSGLGLSICHGIITEHGGTIDVESTLGKGTTFIIALPVYRESGELLHEISVSLQEI